MEQLELDGIAEAIIREGKQEDDEPPRLEHLSIALLGRDAIDYAPNLIEDGALVRIHGRYRIYLRRKLPIERKMFATAHELAEWWLKVREHYRGADVEDAANYIAAAIVAPRRAFRRAISALGQDLPELASVFRTTQTLVALREAEIDRLPRAVVTPALVRVRGPEEWAWPDERTVRMWARHPIPGLRKTTLTDDTRRIVIDADAEGAG